MAVLAVYSWGAVLLHFCLLLCKHLPTTSALKYNVTSQDQNRVWHFVDGTYGFMYGKDKGPWPYTKGPSYSNLDLKVVGNQEDFVNGAKVRVAFMKLIIEIMEDGNMGIQLVNLCDVPKDDFADDGNPKIHEIDFDGSDPPVANINRTYDVPSPMPLLVQVQLCPGTSDTTGLAGLTGRAVFENPYGYLPGAMYPLLPLNFAIGLTLALVFSIFTYLLVKHRETSLPLHFGSFVVLGIGILDSLSWTLVYIDANRTGTPLCCPSPSKVVFALTMNVMLRASFRSLILCVCLGYGIVHPKLSKVKTFFVILLTALFIITGIYSAWYRTLSYGTLKQKSAADVPAFFVDSTFLVWIYLSLISQLEDLQAKGEIFKLEMYQKLTRTVVVALCFYIVCTTFLIFATVAEPTWLWHWIWIVDVAQDIISACMLIAVCIIWRPSPTSNMLSWSKQVPVNEDDASIGYSWDSDEEDHGVEDFGVEMDRAFAILGEDDDAPTIDDMDYDDIQRDTSMDRLDHDDIHPTRLSSKT